MENRPPDAAPTEEDLRRITSDKVALIDRLLDVVENEIVPRKMIHERRFTRVVHRIRQIAHQDNILPGLNHLANSKGAA